VTITDLEPGEYYIVETDADGNRMDYDEKHQLSTGESFEPDYASYGDYLDCILVEAVEEGATEYEMGNLVSEVKGANKGKVTVTKKVTDANGKEVKPGKMVVYVALFKDEALTKIATEVSEIVIENAASGTYTFTELDYGTYYLPETDKDGNPIRSGVYVRRYL